MRNYKDSDYALNKYSEGIVYRFADGRTETIFLQDYLSANPDKTPADFAQLKTFSDDLYHEQIIVEHRTGRLDVSINGLEDTERLSTTSLDREQLEKRNQQAAMKAATLLLNSGDLTTIQRRRFLLHFMQGLSLRQIAAQEGVHFTSVQESMDAATRKLKKFFEKL